eukprot:4032019-Alexandrium_andersonii.AAC.1
MLHPGRVGTAVYDAARGGSIVALRSCSTGVTALSACPTPSALRRGPLRIVWACRPGNPAMRAEW